MRQTLLPDEADGPARGEDTPIPIPAERLPVRAGVKCLKSRRKARVGMICGMNRISVYVFAHDPVLQAGVASQLRGLPDIAVVADGRPDDSQVALVVADVVDEPTTTVMRAIQRNGVPRVVGVIGQLDAAGVLAAIEAGACGLLRRAEATTSALVRSVQAAANGDGSLPPDLLGILLKQVAQIQQHVLNPRGLSFSGLTDREAGVLRLVADGFDTAEIANTLCYSQRTVKNVLHDMTARFNLRNRSHAVAYAVRQGLI